ncbi:MAG TPA: NUDIX hydrolase [Candidatus Nitrosotenuis sp.]|jgi:8-oxo-dGTP pyrophosphatase MutT (NUDIX family)|nr:NUDIX hydrolase [Candidatus Nitrosotenuis sp.]
MPRTHLLQLLDAYGRTWVGGLLGWRDPCPASQKTLLARFRTFVQGTPGCLLRCQPEGHVTASALVASEDLEQVLLTLHRRLGKWIQLGGHADGEPLPQAAWREAHEESGLPDLRFLPYEEACGLDPAPPLPFDLDIHEIPARPGEPGHLHYDVRFVMVTSLPGQIRPSAESRRLAWLSLEEARRRTGETSMQRQFDKLEFLKFRLRNPDASPLGRKVPFGKEQGREPGCPTEGCKGEGR